MAKKRHARQLREQREQDNRVKYKQANTSETQEKVIEPESTVITSATNSKEFRDKKSTAKMAGLKSMFILSESELLMTSFGRGNAAVIEKYVTDNRITDLNDAPAFTAQDKDSVFSLSGRKDGTADNPLHINEMKNIDSFQKTPGMDMIGIKESLEKYIFNTKDAFKDNIHIQLAYNILDIEKILAPVLNNIVYEIQNLTRDAQSDNFDIIGQMSLKNSYDVFCNPQAAGLTENALRNIVACKEKFDRIISMPQRTYMGDALYYPTGDKTKNGRKECDADYKRYYYEISLISMARQMLFHGNIGRMKAIYTLDEAFDNNYRSDEDYLLTRKEARETLKFVFSKRVESLNSGFIDMAKKDLAVLFSVYEAKSIDEKTALVCEYYDFIVKKNHKNLGFSLKKLREEILSTEEGKSIKAKCEKTMWSKFVKNFDFISQHYYAQNPDHILKIVENLRASENDEEQCRIYSQEAMHLWNEIRPVVVEHLLANMNTDKFKAIKGDPDVTIEMLEPVSIPEKASCFSELMYLLTLFLNGKEINDLLTQLISKFESIQSFNYVLEQRGLCTDYKANFSIFANSGNIAKELRYINSFARMQKEDPSAKKALYIEAAQILGFGGDEEDLDDYVELMLTKDNDKKKEIETELKRKNKRLRMPNKGFRNFIANNVVESAKFKYLVRYTNPDVITKCVHNDKVLSFMLENIPDAQIQRYYVSCVEDAEASCEVMRNELRRALKGISFESFADVNQAANADNDEDKRHKQSIIGLYLAIAYLLVKNLVYVNARYSMAFHCFERDSELMGAGRDADYLSITQKFIDEKRINKKSRNYLSQNISNTDENLIRVYRNNIAHMNVLRKLGEYIVDIQSVDSYYSLYHYIMQRLLMEYCRKNNILTSSTTEGYFDTLSTYHRYRKDFVKALNVPFGYNLARYKNLSIEGLFDMHNVGEETSAFAAGD